jgi:tetratricopeptide (TPR) repeat protein
MRTAIGFFEKALEADPLFARAFAGLADSWNVLGNLKALAPGEAYPRAKVAAQQGLAVDDAVAELHTSLGFVHRHWDWDWEAAERSYRRAIELNPGYPIAHRWYGHLLAGLGRHEESIAESARAVELDPLNLLIRGALGDSHFYARRYDEAIALYRETLEMDATFLAGHTDLARALELSGRYDEAIAEFRAAEALAPKGPPEPSSGLAHVYAAMGRRDEAMAIVRELLELSTRRYVSPYGIASIHAVLGDLDTALDWLERAHAEHDQTLVWLKVHPRLDPLRGHPRYRALLRKMRLDG